MDGRAGEWLRAGSFFEWPAPIDDTRKLRIFHAEFGDPQAPTLALLHGFPTSSVDWYDVVGALSREHRVCVLDLPGFGFSDKPKGERQSLQRDSELVGHYLAEVLGARSGAVVAHDRGDSVALVFDRPPEDNARQIVYERMDWTHPNRRGYYEKNKSYRKLSKMHCVSL